MGLHCGCSDGQVKQALSRLFSQFISEIPLPVLPRVRKYFDQQNCYNKSYIVVNPISTTKQSV